MSNLKKWRQVGEGEFHKWTEPGDELEGRYEGQRDGKYGPLGTLARLDGTRISFPLHTALLSRIEDIEIGAEILIRYTGLQTSKTGREFKAFDVFVADPAMLKTASAADPDDDIPF